MTDEIEVPATEPDPPYVDIEPVPDENPTAGDGNPQEAPIEDPEAETPSGVEPA